MEKYGVVFSFWKTTPYIYTIKKNWPAVDVAVDVDGVFGRTHIRVNRNPIYGFGQL